METIGLPATTDQVVAASWVRLDVRRRAAYEADGSRMAHATWHDPDRVDDWGPQLAARGVRECLVYCVHGHEVSRDTAARLRELGVRAHHLAGGIEAWRAAGLPLEPKEQP